MIESQTELSLTPAPLWQENWQGELLMNFQEFGCESSETKILLFQPGRSELGVIFIPQSTSGGVQGHFGCHKQGGAIGIRWVKVRGTGKHTTMSSVQMTKHYLMQHVNNAAAEKFSAKSMRFGDFVVVVTVTQQAFFSLIQ